MNKFIGSIYFYLIIIVILTMPLCTGLFGAHLINGHDALAGLIRAESMNKYMGHGQFLVRWSPEINLGYGYPMFNFYPPFFSFISVLIFQLTQNMVLAMNWACILFWILSGFGMFLLAREYWGNEGGIFSAVLYIYAPYHIIDLYVRGAFAEFSAFAFFPFLLFSILKMSQKVSLKAFLLGVVSVFGLSLVHNIMSMLFLPIAVVYMFYLYIFSSKEICHSRESGNPLPFLLPTVCIFVIGLMMSSFFWLPALVEKQYLNMNFLIAKHYDFHENFITLKNLFWPFHVWTMDHISFQVGVIHTLLGLASIFCVGKIFKLNKQSGFGYIFFLMMALLAIFLTLPVSQLYWEHISLLSFIQFPWRILAIIIFAISFLCGAVFFLVNDSKLRIILLIVASFLTIIFYYKTSLKIEFNPDFDQRIRNFIALGDGEYTPKWVSLPPSKRPDRRFEILVGQAQLGPEETLNSVRFRTKIQAIDTSLLCFNAFYFPGWQAWVDGQPVQIYFNNPYGLIFFHVPPGEHDIQVIFSSTPIRLIGVVLSWLGLIVLLVGILYLG